MNQSLMPVKADTSSAVFPDLTPAADDTVAHAPAARPRFAVLKRKQPASDPALGSISATTMNFRNLHEHGTLLTKYMEARKTIFLDRLNWHVCETDGMEFDQYDTPACRWLALHEFGEILGGVRLLPTTAKCGIYTYMLKDAKRGILEDLPTDVLFLEPPVDPTVWEATRFFITDRVPAARRSAVQQKLFNSMATTAVEHGATHILGIVPSVWSRWARRLNVGATPIGAKFLIGDTWSQSVLFNTNNTLP
ncbi:MAG: acyl-homoserine-lactone synthase [Pseudomonadota bacterium]